MENILNRDIVGTAVALALPMIREMVDRGTWGPPGVWIRIESSYFEGGFEYEMEELQTGGPWEGLTSGDFRRTAKEKLMSALSGVSSRRLAQDFPWALHSGQSFHPGAIVEVLPTGEWLAVAVSGAMSQTDEAIAKILMEMIRWLCSLEVRSLEGQDIHVIPL